MLAFLGYAKVWSWHTTDAAKGLPGASGFGWFFRYLTFYSYTLQLLQLGLCVLSGIVRDRQLKDALKKSSEVLSCAVFGLANTVTAMFYAVESATQGLVEGGAHERPWWLGAAVHSINTIVAWIDLAIVEERNFCGKSKGLTVMFGLIYCMWSLIIRTISGQFPYPILNKLPHPWGFIGFNIAGLTILVLLFETGKFMKILLDGSPEQRRRKKER